ncbi:metallophosphoesterase [Edaphobacter albus]|uniref:metallophosphoesterase n=1 Tax=Edaphobacter sp. 4G125 TaxID=2763071 RepID=UPI0016489249|nr:metallophosphoesterase [Edaphobacter sp. 4G125]QNI35584.1 metallophosphoesterase [Edaphobacter sp. 4G125]
MSVALRDSSKPSLTRRRFILGSGLTAAGLAFYAGEIARHEVDVVENRVAIANLPSAFHDFRIAQISDIHLDEFTEPFFLEHVVNKINALAPDLVLVTGDFVTRGSLTFIDSRHAAYRCAEILSRLKAPQTYCVLGNHDVAVSAPLVIGALRSTKIPVLVNEHVPIERSGSRIWLCGADDATRRPDLGFTIPEAPDGPVLLMFHEPDLADSVIKHPRGKFVDLMLSGHSHGGQVRIPFYGPLILPPLGQKYVMGNYRLGKMQLYVNRGIGAVGLPFRFACAPELTIHTLQPV